MKAGGLGRSLPEFALARRITVLVLVLTLLVLGGVALRSIPVELIPRGFSAPFLGVFVPWADAPALDTLDKIVLPLEEELSTVRGLDNLYSASRLGEGSIFMTFRLGTNMDVAYREVRDRIERARLRMPDDVERVFIRKHDDADFPVAVVGIAADPDAADLYGIVHDEVLRRLERIEGVAAVQAEGLVEKEVLIELDRERLEARGLDLFALAQTLARDNFSLASGSVRSAEKKLLLRSVARYRDREAVEDLVVAPAVRLRDIATVRYQEPERELRVRVNSRPAFAAMVQKEAEANTLQVAREVRRAVTELGHNPRLRGMQIDVIMDQGEIIKSSLGVLLSSGLQGAVFATLVLFFFLHRFRLSLIVALAIPVSLVVALVVMFFAGESLNVISLLGLMISVGLLVDNAVVVGENIVRLHRDGVEPRTAAVRGTQEVALAITTSTLTSMVVFLPVALVEGQGQFFLLRLAIPIAVSLLASLGVALVVVPLAIYLALGRGRSAGAAGGRRAGWLLRWLGAAYERSFGRMQRWSGRALSWSLHHRFELVLLVVVMVVGTQLLARGRLSVIGMAEDEQGFFEIDVELPENLSFEDGQRWFDQAERKIEALKDELGLDFYVLVQTKRWGEIQGELGREVKRDPREATDRILAELPQLPGAKFHTGEAAEDGEEDELSVITLTLYGEDAERLERVATELEPVFAKVPGVLGIKRTSEAQPRELALRLDRELAQRQGVDPTRVAATVAYALRGAPLPRVFFGGRDIPVRVRFEEADRQGLAALGSFAVTTEEGAQVALKTLVQAVPQDTAATIRRQNKRVARPIPVELIKGQEEATRRSVRALADAIDLPEGVRFGAAPRGPNLEEIGNLRFAALLSIAFVYLLMAFLFESVLMPLAILVTIPLANLGVLWLHLLAGRDLDALGMVGIVILIGVVVNNGIVLLDCTLQLRGEGMERTPALMVATERRFRPIMMTALTTVCGMVPMALGEAPRMGLSYKSFGLTLIGGMVVSTVLTLVVVPVVYVLLEDARNAVRRALAGERAETPGRRAGFAPRRLSAPGSSGVR